MNKKLFLIPLLIALTVLLSGCGRQQIPNQNINGQNTNNQIPVGQTNGNVIQTATTIEIKNFTFSPQMITIKKDVNVTWVNNDNASHQVEMDAVPENIFTKSLLSQIMAPNQTYTFTFGAVGTYNYHCKLHPEMKGTIIVVQ